MSYGCVVASPMGCQKVDQKCNIQVWLLAIKVAAARSAHVRPRVLLAIEAAMACSALAFLRALYSLFRRPRARNSSGWGRRTITLGKL